MKQRNTIQKALVMEAANKLDHPTAEQVYAYVMAMHPSISRGTIYRNLSQLVEHGELRKVIVSDGADHFDTTLKDHYHIRCKSCGRVDDVELKYQPRLLESITNTGGFLITEHDILVGGICPGCQVGHQPAPSCVKGSKSHKSNIMTEVNNNE